MRLPVTISLEPDEEVERLGSFGQKWLTNGRCSHNVQVIDVEVEMYNGALKEVVRACLGHEVGHSELLRRIEQQDMAKLDRYMVEVDAWVRWAQAGNTPQALNIGMVILDALNSYRRAYGASEEVWAATRLLVESWSDDPETLRKYEPLEPDPDEPPPVGCGGTGEAPGGLGGGEPREDTGDEDGDEPGEGSEPGEGDEDGDGAPEGDGDGDEPEDEGDDEPREPGEDGQGAGGGYGGSGDHEDGEVREGEAKPEEPRVDHSERDRWLHQKDGIAAAQAGRGTLAKELTKQGWDDRDLPPLTQAILGRED
jgi:hypothetical protein